MSEPTAKQLNALEHETPSRSLTPDVWYRGVGRRLGLGTIDHFEPSQCSIRVPISAAWNWPTAKQFVVLVHAIALSVPPTGTCWGCP